jgi:hypothetical protein
VLVLSNDMIFRHASAQQIVGKLKVYKASLKPPQNLSNCRRLSEETFQKLQSLGASSKLPAS